MTYSLLTSDNIFKVVVIGILVYLVYIVSFRKNSYEMMTVISPDSPLDKIEVLPFCKDMNPDSLLAAFDFDIDRLSAVLVSLKIDPDIMRNKANYPKISSYLVSKGLLTEFDCVVKPQKK